MASVAHPPVTRERFNALVAELYGEAPAPQPPASAQPQRWPQAVAQVEAQLCAKLRVEVLPERLRKALELVLANAVTLHADGTASVQSGKQNYTLAPECPCADAKHRTELCKHTLAVELHRRALALLEGTAYAPAPGPTPAAPSPSLPAAAAALPPAVPTVPSAPASHAWNVHEAPASACFKFRVGTMELMYTLRGIDDAELQRRITATLPTLQEVLEACEERAARRAAEREAVQAQQAQAPIAPAGVPQGDLQALLQQAVQQALAAQAAVNGQAHGTPPPAPPSTGTAAANGGAPFCHVHQAPLELRSNERGSWWSHWVASEKRYCKGE
jgi:hypothetical protein